MVLGDFNVILNSDERLHESGIVRDSGDELELFLSTMRLADLRFLGNVYTWTNDHKSCKLDRIVVIDQWL